MHDTFRKLMYAGMGVFSITKEKADQVINELVQKGQINHNEARSMVDDLVKKGEQEREALANKIREEVINATNHLGLVTREEYNELKGRLEVLESTIKNDSH